KSLLQGVPSLQQLASDSTQANKNLSKGALIYREYCSSCHGSDGRGTKDSFPPLAENNFVDGDKNRLISVMFNGKDTKKYPGKMTPFAFLSDDEIARLLTYIRSNFGNESSK